MKKISFYLLMFSAALTGCNKSETIGGGSEDGTIVFDDVTVIEYTPAPGQFINDDGPLLSAEEAVRWAKKRIDGKLYVSLGAFGGYITVRPSRTVENRDGYDFGIAGNPISTHNEPGIVWVSPDGATWYRLEGSDPGRNDYTVTYHRSDEPGDVQWEDGDGEQGVVKYLASFHSQNYYPLWADRDGTLTLSGTLLEPKNTQVNNQERNEAYGWGYADNLGSDALYDERGRYVCNRFDISDAVDRNGDPVRLESIQFIKVQSALLFNMGSTGELSTEVCGFILFD